MELTSISTTQLKEYTKKASEMESSVSYIQGMIWDIEAKIAALNTELTNISNRKWKVPEPPQKPVEPILQEYEDDQKETSPLKILNYIFIVFCYIIWFRNNCGTCSCICRNNVQNK